MKNLGKLSLAALLVSAACGASAGELYSGDKGTMSLSGDVEYDVNYTATKQSDNGSSDQDTANQNGRIKLDFNSQRVLDNGYFAEVDVQPIAKSDQSDGDTLQVDDAYFKFGMQDAWDVTVGRKEATDMMPLGQDTVAGGSGSYQLEYSRGRTGNGSVLAKGYIGGLTAELMVLASSSNTIVGTSVGGVEVTMDNTGDSANPIWTRPVLSYTAGDITVAVGMEAAVNVEDSPIGYGAKFTYANDAVTVNVAGAMTSYDHDFTAADSVDVKTSTLNANMTLTSGLGVGVFFTEFDEKDSTGAYAGLTDYKVSETYVSYKVSDILGMDNFDIYPAAYYQVTDWDGSAADQKDTGMRLRFKYYF